MYAKICIIKLLKVPNFLVFFFLPPNTVFLLLIIIRQESAEAALNVRYMNSKPLWHAYKGFNYNHVNARDVSELQRVHPLGTWDETARSTGSRSREWDGQIINASCYPWTIFEFALTYVWGYGFAKLWSFDVEVSMCAKTNQMSIVHMESPN